MFPIILEVAISLIVIYFLMSTLVSFINETIAILLNLRGQMLFKSLKHLFAEKEKEKTWVDKIYKSNYITNLASKIGWFKSLARKPEYINSHNFASALMDQIKLNDPTKPTTNFDELKHKVEGLCDNSFLKTKLQEIISELEDNGKANLFSFKENIELWFNSYMETVTIIYKNSVRNIVFIISAFICFSMNIDSLVLIEYFYENKEKREIMVNYADHVAQDKYVIADSITGEKRLELIKQTNKKILANVNAFELPIGWKSSMAATLENERQVLGNTEEKSMLYKFIGLFLTTISLTLGAPFWYQMMVKLLDIKKEIEKK